MRVDNDTNSDGAELGLGWTGAPSCRPTWKPETDSWRQHEAGLRIPKTSKREPTQAEMDEWWAKAVKRASA